MTSSYEYTPYIWPVLSSAAFLAALGIYGIRHRSAPGGIPFVIMMAGAVPWVLANGLGVTSTEPNTKIFWWNCQMALFFLLIIAQLCFGLEYAGLGKWVSRRTVSSLSIVPLAFVPLIFTNENHHFVWTRIWFDGYVRFVRGPANWGAIVYGYFLVVVHLAVLVWLFARSPRHRWIVAAIIIASLSMVGASFLNIANWTPVEPLNPMVLVMNFAVLPYALAVFRLRMFDVVPVARDTVIERMADGMVVLDAENRISDANEAVQELLGIVKSKLISCRVEEVLDTYPDLVSLIRDSGATQGEVSFGNAPARWYQISISPLIDARGFQLGRLISLHDITEQKRAQAQILDQQRTLAMLKEREMLARELHDGIGQMLAAAHLQVKSASDLLARGDTASVESYLHHLAELTQEAKESVRDFLLGVKARSSVEQSLLASLREYINQYNHSYGIHTELIVPPELEERRIDSTIEAQLQPIIQEALTNVRRHSGVCSARVIFALCDNQIRVTVEDGGRGFDPEEITEKQGFGLRSMRGRAEMVGTRFEVNSSPGKGTQVIIQVPWRKEET